VARHKSPRSRSGKLFGFFLNVASGSFGTIGGGSSSSGAPKESTQDSSRPPEDPVMLSIYVVSPVSLFGSVLFVIYMPVLLIR